jgi:hypothetical protein
MAMRDRICVLYRFAARSALAQNAAGDWQFGRGLCSDPAITRHRARAILSRSKAQELALGDIG